MVGVDGSSPFAPTRSAAGKFPFDGGLTGFLPYGQCGACAPIVRVLTWRDLHRERCDWTVASPGWLSRIIKNQAPWRAARCVSKKRQQPPSRRTARCVATRVVTHDDSRDCDPGVGTRWLCVQVQLHLQRFAMPSAAQRSLVCRSAMRPTLPVARPPERRCRDLQTSGSTTHWFARGQDSRLPPGRMLGRVGAGCFLQWGACRLSMPTR